MDNNIKDAIMISDLMTDEHVLITRSELVTIESAILSLSIHYDEEGEKEISRSIMDIWHKLYDLEKEIKRKENRTCIF